MENLGIEKVEDSRPVGWASFQHAIIAKRARKRRRTEAFFTVKERRYRERLMVGKREKSFHKEKTEKLVCKRKEIKKERRR